MLTKEPPDDTLAPVITRAVDLDPNGRRLDSEPAQVAPSIAASADAVACCVCGGRAWSAMPDTALAHLVQCDGCDLVRVRDFPPVSDLLSLYGANYYRNPHSHLVGYENYEADQPNIMRTARRRLRLIERYEPDPRRLLDVGCALGYFMEAAREHGWQPTGLDVSSFAASVATRRDIGEVLCGELSDARFANATFDVITMWDVVEHMRDPLGQLRECHRILRESGLLVLTTPDIGSPVAKMTGARWMGFKLADEHLYYFSRRSMVQMLARAGFETIDAFHVGKYVTLAFFAKRLTMYLPRLATLTARLFRLLRLEERSVYVNPRDIVCIVARKRTH